MGKMTEYSLRELLCDRFILAQEASGLNKSSFALRVGLSPPQLTNIARRRNPPSHIAIMRAVEEFGFKVDWFYGGHWSGVDNPALQPKLKAAQERKRTRAA
jgi:transcriptional regulator with XRE-family HTH domain